MELMKLVQKATTYIEDKKTPFFYTIILFFSSVTLRNFLEIFSDKAKMPFKFFSPQSFIYYQAWISFAISFIHYYVFWTVLAMAAAIVVKLFTKESIVSILKVVLSAFLIINITPLVDLLLTNGMGSPIKYVKPNDFFDIIFVLKFLTRGMVLTSIVCLSAIFLYIKTKTLNNKKAFFGSLCVYLLLHILSLLPLILKTRHPVPIIKALLIIGLIEASALLYFFNKKYLIALLRDLRIGRLIYFELLFIAGMFLARNPILPILSKDIWTLPILLILVALTWLISIMFNNIEDQEIDKISNPNRPLTTQAIPLEIYRRIALFLVFVVAAFSLILNFQTFLIMLVLIGNSFLYSLPPIRLKRVVIFSKLCTAANSLILIMLGFIYCGGELANFPEGITWYFLTFVTLMANIIDLKDYEGDKKAGITTLATLLGLEKAKIILGGITLIGYCVLSLILLDLRLLLPTTALGMIQLILITRKNYSDKWVIRIHLVSLLLLIVYLLA